MPSLIPQTADPDGDLSNLSKTELDRERLRTMRSTARDVRLLVIATSIHAGAELFGPMSESLEMGAARLTGLFLHFLQAVL